MFPKGGNILPPDSGEPTSGSAYASAVAAALRSELRNSHHAAKIVMRWTGANERTVKNWLAGASGPSGEHLIDLMKNSNTVLDVVLTLARRHPALTTQKFFETGKMLVQTAQLLAMLMEEMEGRTTPRD